MSRVLFYALCALYSIAFVATGQFTASAREESSPIVFASYGLTSTAYIQSLAILRTLENKLDKPVKIEPMTGTLARQMALQSGAAGYCICGITSFLAQEGLSEYGLSKMGPQPLRTILMSRGSFGVGVATAKSARIRSLADLKGRKIAWIGNSDESNFGMIGALKFAGIEREQVSWVEFPSMKEAREALLEGKIDAGFMATTSPTASALAASPRGIFWPPMPGSDIKGWWRLKSASPYLSAADPHLISRSLSGWQGASHPFPILTAVATQDSDQVYALTKSIIENYELFKEQAGGWHIYAQNFNWVIPYHEGAIRYFREIGMWDEKNDAYNDGLIYRQQILSKAWKAYTESASEEEAFAAGWKSARQDALEQAGLQFQLN